MTFDKYLPNLNNCIATSNFPNETIIGFAGQVPIIIDLENTNGLCYQVTKKNKHEIENFIENLLLSIISRTFSQLYEISILDLTLNDRNTHLSQLAAVFRNVNIIRRSDDVVTMIENFWNKAIRVKETKLLSSKNLIEFNKKAIEEGSKSEPYRFLVIYDIPNNLDNKCIELLEKLVNQASKAGIYLFMTFDFSSQNLIDDRNSKVHNSLMSIIKHSVFIGLDRNQNYKISGLIQELQPLYSKLTTKQNIHFSKRPFNYDETNSELIVDIINSVKSEPNKTKSNRIEVPIGYKEDGALINFAIGELANAYFGFIIGIPGQGKSALINKIIWEISQKYTKQQVLLYLIDFSNVSFKFHRNHPNLHALIEDSSNDNIIKAVDLLDSLKEEYFDRTTNKGVSNIDTYNEKAISEGREVMPHILVIIDEVHHFYNDITITQPSREVKKTLSEQELRKLEPVKERANDCFDFITREGRKVGIHLLLATQDIDRLGIQNGIVNRMPIRVGFKTTQYDKALEFFPNTKREIASLSILEAFYTNDGDINTEKCYIKPPNYRDEEYLEAYQK